MKSVGKADLSGDWSLPLSLAPNSVTLCAGFTLSPVPLQGWEDAWQHSGYITVCSNHPYSPL